MFSRVHAIGYTFKRLSEVYNRFTIMFTMFTVIKTAPSTLCGEKEENEVQKVGVLCPEPGVFENRVYQRG